MMMSSHRKCSSTVSTDRNLIGVYLKLLSVLECPVCLDYLTKPVALCNEGHALCSKCKSNISSCPMCRNPISSTRGLILDQIIETLLYPCYKMGCGSLLKRGDAENHDLNCTLENATDKQAVLHNNLLKNIEENFASFIVQPEIVKETRTVGTITGKVKTADVLVQTSIPFSSSLIMEKLKPSSTFADCSSSLNGLPKAGPTTGISICPVERSPNISSNTTNVSNLAFPLPQTSSFTFAMTPDGLNNTNMSSMYSFPQDSSLKLSLEPFHNISGFLKGTAGFNPNAKPFIFNSNIENNSEKISKNSSKKPSTNLSFAMESGPSSHRTSEAGASNDFFIRNQDASSVNLGDSIDSRNVNHLASTSSSPAPKLFRNDSQLGNQPFQNIPSTNLASCSASTNNNQPFVSNDSLTAATQRKRPTTNLCGLTSLA